MRALVTAGPPASASPTAPAGAVLVFRPAGSGTSTQPLDGATVTGAVVVELAASYDRMGAAAHQIDPTQLFSSGTVAPYAVGGADAYRDVTSSPGVNIASVHEYDETEAESNHGPETRAAPGGKPVIVGESGIRAGPGCATGFATRAQRVQAKTQAYLSRGSGALAWAWQPGSPTCEYGTLDTDTATQQVLRANSGQASTAAASSEGVAAEDSPTSAPSASSVRSEAPTGGGEPGR